MLKTVAFARLLGNKVVFALHQAAGILARINVTQVQVARQRAKKRNPVSNQHGHARDDKALNEPRAQKALNREATVYIDMQTKTEWISSRQSVVNFVFNERLLPVHQTLPRGQLHTLNWRLPTSGQKRTASRFCSI